MKIIIDIPEEVYKAYKMDTSLSSLNEDQRGYAKWYLINGLVNGTPLSQEPSEDAIKYFDVIYNLSQTYGMPYSFIKNEIKKIMKALKALPKEFCDDVINRQAAIDAFERFIHEFGIKDEPYNYGEMALSPQNVPPVNSIEKVGRWEKVTAENRDGSISWWYACSECGAPCPKTDYGTDYFGSYCSNCGAKMKEVQE